MQKNNKHISIITAISSILLLISSINTGTIDYLNTKLISKQIEISSEYIDFLISLRLGVFDEEVKKPEAVAKKFIIDKHEKQYNILLIKYRTQNNVSNIFVLSLLLLNLSIILLATNNKLSSSLKMIYYFLLFTALSMGIVSIYYTVINL